MLNRIAKWNFSLALVGALVVAGWIGVGASPAQDQGKTATLTGTLSDSMCGMKHMSQDPKKCMADCIKDMGMKYSLVVGDKNYTLEGKEAEIGKLSSGKITVTGTVQGTTVKVATVAAAK